MDISGGIDWTWAVIFVEQKRHLLGMDTDTVFVAGRQHLSDVGGIEVEVTRRINRGVECVGQDEEEAEVIDGRVQGGGGHRGIGRRS